MPFRSESPLVNNRPIHLLIVAFVLLVATGCSTETADQGPAPTSTPAPTAVPTLTPGATSVGDLIERVDQVWPTVTSMRTTFWATMGSPQSTPPALGAVTVETVIVPASRHVTQLQDGAIVDEQIALNGRVYMKGSIVVAAIAPMVGTEAWVEVDPAAATSDNPLSMQVNYLLEPVHHPFGLISPETLASEAIPLDPITIGDRTCQNYTFGDQSGNGIRYELSIDEANLPCQLLQFGGDYVNVTLYEFNVPGLSISAPDVATPEPAP